VTGVHVEVGSGRIFSRTDVGGAYLVPPAPQPMQPLLDWVLPSQTQMYSVLSLATAEPSTLCLAVGQAPWTMPSYILCSTTGLPPFTAITPSNWTEPVQGNEPLRYGGERLSIVGSRVLFGGRSGEMWLCESSTFDSVCAWSSASVATNVSNGMQGIGAVVQTATTTFAAVRNLGVLACPLGREMDPASYSLVPGSPLNPMRLVWEATEDVVWVAADEGVCVLSSPSTPGSSFKCSVPASDPSIAGWCAVAAGPGGSAVVAPYRFDTGTTLYTTTSLGSAWTALQLVRSTDVTWAAGATSLYATNPATSSIAVTASGQLVLGDWYSHWQSTNFSFGLAAGATVGLTAFEVGHEEVVVHAVFSPPAGAGWAPVDLFTGCADVSGFAHDQGLSGFPSARFQDGQDTYNFDSWGGVLVRSAGDRFVSTQNGYTGYHNRIMVASSAQPTAWADVAWDTSYPTLIPLRVAASSASTFTVVAADGSLHFTNASGAPWHNVTASPPFADSHLSIWGANQPLASCKLSGAVFLLTPSAAPSLRLLLPSNPAAFLPLPLNLSALGVPPAPADYAIYTPPQPQANLPGELYLVVGGWGGGIWRIWPSGGVVSPAAVWNAQRLPGMQFAYLGAVGPGVPGVGAGNRTFWAFGVLDGDSEKRLYVGDGYSASWLNLFNASEALGDGTSVLAASQQVPGRVFIGTGGRGVFVAGT
jgi:xyloglucan-specific exo-beta-1,4-glucanase